MRRSALGRLRRDQLAHLAHERVLRRLEPQVLLDLAAELAGLLAPGRRPRQLQVGVADAGHDVVGQAGPGLRHPALADGAVGDARRMIGIVVEHGIDALLHRQRRRPAGVLDLAEIGGKVVGGRLSRGEDGLVDGPGARVWQHGLLGVFRGRVHQADRVDGAGCRAEVCGLALSLAPMAAQVSGCGHSNVYILLQ